MMAEHQAGGRGKDFLVGAVIGGVLGAVTALLLAPKTGKELRADLADSLQTVSEKTQDLAVKVGGKTQELSRQLGTQTGEWMHKAKEVVDTVTDEVKAWKESRKEIAVTEEEMMPADAEVLGGRNLK